MGCSVLVAEQPLLATTPRAAAVYPQRPLRAAPAELAVVMIGGFGDEISGIIEQTARFMPPLAKHEARAYYHWNGGVPADAAQGVRLIAEHVRRFQQSNPQANVVLLGHSFGASTALQVAQLLAPATQAQVESRGRILLLTIDPSDRMVQPKRPAAVTWWGNCYVVHSQSDHDFIVEWGGRWGHCQEADVNIRFDGRRTDEYGQQFIHDNALALLLSARGSGSRSLYQWVLALLNQGSPAT